MKKYEKKIVKIKKKQKNKIKKKSFTKNVFEFANNKH